MGVVSQKLRDSAKGQPCTFQTPFCNHDPETTVLCHLPSNVKGMGTKSDDWNAAFGCSACHEAIDTHKFSGDGKFAYCYRALQRTHKIWRDLGLITIAGDNPKPRKPSSKTLPRKLLWQPGVSDGD